MPRRPRFDEPGCLHHVMSRGIARRTIFESRADVRFFLSLLAHCVRNGQIELHSHTVLSTHFHLLVRSKDGQLSETMRWVLNRYVRYFNRTRRRDGPLMRGRFQSIPVHSEIYLRTLIRYIDQNAVDAGLVATPADHEHCSARWHRSGGKRPRWLARDLVDSVLDPLVRAGMPRDSAYDRAFCPVLNPRQRDWIKQRLSGKARGFDPLDSLLSNSASVQRWAVRKAKLAGGTRPGLAVIDPGTAEEVVGDSAADLWSVDATPSSGRLRKAIDLMRVALLRDTAGVSFVGISARLSVSHGMPQKLYRLHRECMREVPYQVAYAKLVNDALERMHGGG